MFSYSRNFWAITFAMFLFMTSFNMILPEMNDYITQLGGREYKGLIIALFTVSAAISRPFSGKMADTIGRKSTMYIGTVVCVIITFLYPLSGSVAFFLFLRFMHGFSTGFLPTGATALITDILPINKRGQGMGVFGTGISLGIGVGQFLGTPLAQLLTVDGLFFASGILAMISILMIKSVKETLKDKKRFHPSVFLLKKTEVYEKNVLPVAMTMFLSAACSGLLFVISPDLSGYLGIENKGWFFIFYVISTILVRLFSGKLSDNIGRRKSLMIGMLFLITSMLMVAVAETVFWYTAASIVFGVATGINSPTLFAWMADLSPSHRRGIGSGTLFISLELGILFGSASTLFIYNSTFESVFHVFAYGAFLSILAMLFLLFHLMRYPNERVVD
jgi:MFS family permease